MGYVRTSPALRAPMRARRPALGAISATDALIGIGANALLPGSGPVVVASASVLRNLLGGAGRDAQRRARRDWFEAAAKQGSVVAARVLLGGITETAGNESPMYEEAVRRLTGTPVMDEAMRQGPWWMRGDDDSSSGMRARIEAEIRAMGGTVPNQPVGSGGNTSNAGAQVVNTMSPDRGTTMLPTPNGTRPQMLPGMTTTAAYNYMPWIIGGGVVLAAVMLSGRRR
jgi:hypothetical protein